MIRVRVTSAKGSTPREAGAEMFVLAHATRGTIGGGQLEYMAIDRARAMLARGEHHSEMNIPLGPEIGQCCGGRVALSLDEIAELPAEPEKPRVFIFGAGHVGRALGRALKLLPIAPLLIDQRIEELAQASDLPTRLSVLPEADLRDAPQGSSYLILTHDHALDFLLAAEALKRQDAPYIGMIGSATKRAQFQRFARSQGVDPSRLTCPIGAGACHDKRPEIIAALTAAELITRLTSPVSSSEKYP
ncbi:xanthine dehydrogenase accessory protein XdhC [Paracoccus aminophilus]|uniref:Xanthine dehydrogenase, accessory protein XdhC n=1 Tax=Paracoccus aminophilus JCM 7686 TaxID=1367847 RepID=S5YBD3_PARAH|nr:xanthine dehydrogenase accessory protein XdhC [Paracoccus aminophilus]AGT08758.1 xanthine dehydrogenase, accessory protein XdhC [Paracoccus aminophilus JCM 7686]